MKSFLPLALSGLIIFSFFPSSVHAGTTTPPIPKQALLAAANPASIIRDVKNSVFRVGVMLTGTLEFPQAILDDSTGTFFPGEKTSVAEISAFRTGSAFAVSREGYLLTNAHVVDNSFDSITADLWSAFVSEKTIAFYEECPDCTDGASSTLLDNYFVYLSTYGRWGSNTTYDVVIFDPEELGTFGDLYQTGFKAEIKKIGQPYPTIGKDVAVLKVDSSAIDFKPVSLGSSKNVSAGSTVYVVGYPAIADLSEKSYLVPSLTSGIISAIKPSDLGDYDVIQIDASVKGGNSGGPVFNDAGKVIGIATFGATEADSYNWILPIELGAEYLRELNISPETARTMNILYILKGLSVWVWAGLVTALVFVTGLAVYLHMRRKMRALTSSADIHVPGTGVTFNSNNPIS